MKMVDDSVSVVITCYNQDRYLAESVCSILNQSITPQEIIIVDDGSTDNTGPAAKQFPQAKYIYQDNSGLASARNKALNYCSGTYVVFLDCDDRLLPNALEEGLKAFTINPKAGFVYGHFRYINEDGSFRSEYPQRSINSEHYKSFLTGNFIGMHAAVMYRRNILQECGSFNTSLKACEDYDVYLRISQKYPVLGHNHTVAEYRQHTRNMSLNHELMLSSVLQVLNYQEEYVKNNKRMKRALRSGKIKWIRYYGSFILKKIFMRTTEGNLNIALRSILCFLSILMHFLFGERNAGTTILTTRIVK